VAEREPGGSRDKVLRSLPVRLARWTSGVVGFVATLLGVVFVLFPAIKPEEPPPTKGAKLSNLRHTELSYGQYLDRLGWDRAPYDAPALRRRGILVEFDFAIEGYKDKALPLRWQLIDARRGGQLAKSRDNEIIPEAPKDGGTFPVWVPLRHRRPQRVYVQLQLYGDTGEAPIARKETPPFRAPKERGT